MSFFGFGKKKESTETGSVDTSKLTNPIYDTGRNVDDIVKGLINAINDEQLAVRTHIHKSLCALGDKEPSMVLSKGLNFLNTVSRGQKNHRVLIMNVLREIINAKQALKLPDDLAQGLVVMSTLEIVAENSIDSDWQDSACRLLISLARLYPDLVAKNLIDRFPANQLPHYFIVKALADFAHLYPALFVPHLKEVLSRALPILAMIKQDNLRWVFCAGLGRWAEAVVRVVREDDTVNFADYSGSMHAAIKWCLNENLQVRNQKIRLVAAEAIGYMSHIIETEHLLALLTKIITDMVALMKKEAREDQLPVTIGLQNVVAATVRKNSPALQEHLNVLLTNTHQFMINSIKMESTYTKSEQNQLELMKTFEVIAIEYTDQVITFLQKLIETKEASRVATLRALRHVIVHNSAQLHSYKELIVSGLKNVTNENDLELIHLVRELAREGYLQTVTGEDLVLFVIKGASSSIDALRNESDSVIAKFSTEWGDRMDPVLWPFLLTTLIPVELSGAVPSVCKALSDIAKRKKNDDDFIIDFDRSVNLPKPNAIFARLLILLTQPHGRNSPGVSILRALYVLSPNVHPDLVETWSKRLPVMKRYLDENSVNDGSEPGPNFNNDQWQNLVLNLVRDSIEAVSDDEWTVSLGDALLAQIPSYAKDKNLKRALLSISGLIVQKTQLKEFVHRAINAIFDQADHTSDEERLGCARGLGQASATHTDIVLTKLSTVAKAAEPKKSFFGGAAKGAANEYTSSAKATACLAYGYLAMLTPIELLPSRIEVHVVNNLVPLLNTNKSFEVRENGLKAIDLIGKACSPDRVGEFILKTREELIKCIIQIIVTAAGDKNEKPSSPALGLGANATKLRVLGLEALATLILLPPKVERDVQTHILDNILPLLKLPEDDSIENLHVVLTNLLLCEPTQDRMDSLLTPLEKQIRSTDVLERKRAMQCFLLTLKNFARIISENPVSNSSLANCGKIIGKLIPRITESQLEIRKSGLDCIYVALRIHYFLKKGTGELPEQIQKLGPLRAGLDTTEPDELLMVAKEMALILVDAIEKNHLFPLIDTLVSVLDDPEADGANGACVVLNGLVRARGAELEVECPNFVRTVISSMNKLTRSEQVVTGLLHVVRALCRTFPNAVMTTLLALPTSLEVIRSWQQLAIDRTLVQGLVEFLIDVMNNSQAYEEKREGSNIVYIGTHSPKSATSALSAILTLHEMAPVAKKNYAQLVVTILLRLGSASSIVDPPIKDVEVCLRNLFIIVCKGAEDEEEPDDEDGTKKKEFDDFAVLEGMKSVWPQMTSNYGEAAQETMDLVCRAHPEHVKEMFLFVKPFVNRTLEGVRVTATSCSAVLLSHVKNDRELVHDVINSLLSRSGTDEAVIVKLYSLRGLANLTKQSKDVLHKYVTPVTGALISNLEDSNEQVIMQSMKSVKIVFNVADDEYISPLLLNLCVRLKPAFEKPNPQLREASILLFGSLARFATGSMSDTLINTFFANLPTIVLHLQDNDASVIRACKTCLKEIVPQLGSSKFNSLFETDLFKTESRPSSPVAPITVTPVSTTPTSAKSPTSSTPTTKALEGELIDFDAFAEQFATTFITEFPNRISDLVMNLVVFYKSDWAGVCAGAVLIIGYVLANINNDMRGRVNLRHTCAGLVTLLKSQSALIREKTSKVLGMLHES